MGQNSPARAHPLRVNTGAFCRKTSRYWRRVKALLQGQLSGRAGAPAAETVGIPFTVTVRSVDANWNPIPTNDLVHLTSSDASATLPADGSLSSGTKTFSVTLMSAGSPTITASDLTHAAIGSSTSTGIPTGKGTQTITFGSPANKTYGDPAFNISATASSGLPVAFTIVAGPASVAGNNVALTGSGAVTIRAAQSGDANWNAAANVDQSFNVAQALLTVGAEDQSRSYGATNPVLTVVYSGFVYGQDSSVLTGSPNVTTVADTNSPMGTYPILVDAGTLSGSNYSLAFTNGTLTVTSAVLTVQADDKTRAYGDPNPAPSVTYSGFVNGQDTNILSGTPFFTLEKSLASPVGNYPIVVEQGTLVVSDTNYVFSFVDGVLTVTPAPLLVAADNQSKIYGSANPPITGTTTGLRNGDEITTSFTTTADETSPVGGYAIVPSVSGSVSNYSVTITNGVLAVTPASLVVTADSASKVYGSANPAFTGVISGLLNGDVITATYSSAANNSSPVSNYPDRSSRRRKLGKLFRHRKYWNFDGYAGGAHCESGRYLPRFWCDQPSIHGFLRRFSGERR